MSGWLADCSVFVHAGSVYFFLAFVWGNGCAYFRRSFGGMDVFFFGDRLGVWMMMSRLRGVR